jgi:hypothetical protein
LKSPLNQIQAQLKPERNRFVIDFNIDIFGTNRKKIQLGQNYKKLHFQTGDLDLIFEEMHIIKHGITHLTGSINQFYTNGFSKKQPYYYRIVVPIKKELAFHFYIEPTFFSTDLGYSSSECTEVNFENKKIELYNIKHDKRNYAVIDVNSKVSYDSFVQIVFALLVSYGYVTGFMPGDKGYFVAYQNSKMRKRSHLCFTCLRESISSKYHPIHSNAFGYIREKGKLAEKINAKLRPLSLSEFSNLFQLTHNSLDFSSVLLLIIESSNASLLFMPGGYAIALESLSDIIVSDKKIDLAPISDKILRKKVIKECQDVITNNCSIILDKKSLHLLKSRISSNLNKATNKAQLKAPFDILNIELFEEDLTLLGTRNDFLHGRAPDITDAGENRSIERLNLDIFYCGIRFYTLLNILILKWIGFDNYVVNYPKLQQRYTRIKLPKEKTFRKI